MFCKFSVIKKKEIDHVRWLISQDFHNKVTQTGWLKTTEIYSLTQFWRSSRSLRSRCQQDHVSSEASRARSFLVSSRNWQPQTLLGLEPYHSNLFLHLHAVFFLYLVSSFGRLYYGIRGPPYSSMTSPHLCYICNKLISKEDHFLRSWGLGFQHIFLGGHNSSHKIKEKTKSSQFSPQRKCY